jgi:uncharacterized membrane protein YiaA
MIKKKYDGGYLNTSLAICVLGIGMMIISCISLRSPGADHVLVGGAFVSFYGAIRLQLYQEAKNPPK